MRIGIIDSGLDITDARFKSHICPNSYKDFTGTGITDHHGHGSHIAGLIIKYAKDVDYCLVIAKYINIGEVGDYNIYIAALKWLTDQGVNVINFSGTGLSPSYFEETIIKTHPNILFITAAGNNQCLIGNPNCFIYPALYKLPNVRVVGCRHNGIRCSFSNYGPLVTAWQDGINIDSTLPGGYHARWSGTSQATAIETGIYVNENTTN